jgi:NADH-quinone oxidoreductase subunit N
MVELFYKESTFFIPQTFFLIFLVAALLLFPTYGNLHRSVGVPLSTQSSYFFILCLTLLFSVLPALPVFSNLLSSLFSSSFHLIYALLIFLIGFLSFFFYLTHLAKIYSVGYEIVILFYLVLFSSLTLAVSNDLLIFYLSLEFQALSLYVLASSTTNSTYSTESGLKYFVLGSFASSLILLGISLVYGVIGSLNFFDISVFLLQGISGPVSLACQISFILILVGLFFKVGVAPFHFWVPDVYTGVSLPIFAFFALLPKVAAWAFCVKFVTACLLPFALSFTDLILLVSVCSLLVGAYGAVTQISIKRVLSYSAIGHAGFLVLALSTFSYVGFISNVFYLLIYLLSLIPLLLILFTLSARGSLAITFDNITSTRFIYKFSPLLGVSFSLSLFSLAGIPPFSGFFAKLYLFLGTVSFGFYYITITALLISVASAVYYLKLVRTISIFKSFRSWMFLAEINRAVAYVLSLCVALNIFFFGVGGTLLSSLSFLSLSYYI